MQNMQKSVSSKKKFQDYNDVDSLKDIHEK